MIYFLRLLMLLPMLMLAACVANEPRGNLDSVLIEMGLQTGTANSRLPRYRVNAWRAIDNRSLIVNAGVNDKYLIQLRSSCFNLRSAFYIGFITPDFGLDRFDSIVVRGPGRRIERCSILDIVRLVPR
jgi:hypothetical protein